MVDQGAKGAAGIEKLIKDYGSDGYSVGTSLTWADLMIFDIASNLLSKVPNFEVEYPGLLAVHDTVAKNPKIAEYILNRPVTHI